VDSLSAIDAVLARSARLLDGSDPTAGLQAAAHATSHETGRLPQSGLVYDLDWNEDERLAEWQDVPSHLRDLPAVLRAAIMLVA
jgi:hypothetical protein